MNRKIIWEYWQNPYGGSGPEFVSEEEAIVPDSFSQDNEKTVELKEFLTRPVIPTPMGLVPIQSFREFTEVFEFWIGHSNFYITEQLREIIEFTPGVEIFEVFTPYRFRICIGKAFKGSKVKLDIQRNLNVVSNVELNLNNDIDVKVSSLQNSLGKNFEYWAIYILPNGEMDISSFNTKESYDMQFQIYEEAVKLAGGVIYKYA